MEDLKRKSLSDITNRFNLRPISELRKLVASTSKKPATSSRPGNLIPQTNSISTREKRCSQVSSTSIGSSDVGKTRNPGIAPLHAHPGSAGSKSPGCITGNSSEKSQEGRESDVFVVGPQPSERRKDKGKVTAASFVSSSVGKIKPNQVEKSIAHCSSERKNLKHKDIHSRLSDREQTAISSTSAEKGRSVDLSSSEATRVSRKYPINLSSCSSGKVSGRKNEAPKSCNFSMLETKDMGTQSLCSISCHENAMRILQPSNEAVTKKLDSTSDALTVMGRKAEKRKKNNSALLSFSCPPAMTKSKTKDVTESKTAPPKAKKMRVSPVLPRDAFEKEIAYFKELDAEELVIEEVSSDE